MFARRLSLRHGVAASFIALGCISFDHLQKSSCKTEAQKSSLVVLGSGGSCGVPHLNCLLGTARDNKGPGGCDVCKKALYDAPPHENKNYRGNPSLLIKYANQEKGMKYIQIDVGKTFRENALRWYPRLGIPYLDAVLLTHGHADAYFGLDDLRMAQRPNVPIDIYMSWQTFDIVQMAFPYLVRGQVPEFHGDAAPLFESLGKKLARQFSIPKTFIAQLRWHIISKPDLENIPNETVKVAGLNVTPLPVYHGSNYLSLGYVLGDSNKKVVIITDVSEIPPKVMAQLKKWDIEVLFIDTCHRTRFYPTHINLTQSIPLIQEIGAKKTYLIGLSHEFDYEETMKEMALLKEEKQIDVELAYDGMEISLDCIDLE